jgi:bisphosphoglycerate-dependent phosphoglycerate mutase family 1
MKNSGLSFDIAFTSALKRAIRTLWIALEEMDQMWVPALPCWRLNERFYGALEGEKKAEMDRKYGSEQIHLWRRSFNERPPAVDLDDERYPDMDLRYRYIEKSLLPRTESLKDTLERVLPFWQAMIVPELSKGKNILVVSHGNTIRALVKHLEGISDRDIEKVEIGTAKPLLYEIDDQMRIVGRRYLRLSGAGKTEKQKDSDNFWGVMMNMSYSVQIITMDRKEELIEKYFRQVLYEVKSEIYGCSIKLLTGSSAIKNAWEESFYFASQNIRSHGRLYVLEDSAIGENEVFYDPHSKTCFLFNMDYYGWVKSLALSVAGDILEDNHGIYSVHGACLDMRGHGVCILGGSGAGKTTHTYGLLRQPKVRVVSDDWFFARIFGEDILAYGSEKNFYIRADLADIWKEYSGLVDRAVLDKKGRAVVDLRWVIGKGRILPLTTLDNVIFLKRDPASEEIVRELKAEEALAILEKNGYFNPHLLVKSDFKRNLRSRFFRELFSRVQVHEVNTRGTPEESQRAIGEILTER